MISNTLTHIAFRVTILLLACNILLSGAGNVTTDHLFSSNTASEAFEQVCLLDYLQEMACHDSKNMSDMEDPKPSETETVNVKDMVLDYASELIFSSPMLKDSRFSTVHLAGFSSFKVEIISPPPKA